MVLAIDLGESAGARQLSFDSVRSLIKQLLDSARFGMAASVSMQLADQLPHELWPQLIAAESLYMNQQPVRGLEYIDRALTIDPDSVASLVVKSRLRVYSGDSAEARRLIDRATTLAPADSRLRSVMAEIMVDAGDIETARDSFRAAIDLDPRNADGMLGLSQLPGDNFDEALLQRVEFLVQSRQLPAEDQIKAHFALAHAYDKKSDISRHFRHLKQGNGLKNRSLNYDPSASRREADGIVDFFSPAFFARWREFAGNAARVIFIVGFPRCGSTLVEQILSSHPLVSAAGESLALRHALRDHEASRATQAGYPHWLDGCSSAELAGIADGYLARLDDLFRRDVLTDKLLDNYKLVGLIHVLFRDAKIIHVQRNPVATCYSCYKRLFNLGSVPYAYSLQNLAERYRDYRRVIRHWHETLPGRVYTVDYETLVAEQESVTRGLLAHCGLPWSDACLDFHENARTVQTNSNVQVRQPLYRNSLERWKACKPHLGPLLTLSND